MGFCFFNNVAIGVMHAMEQYHLTRIAIIDFDVHHGNGTQHIFQHTQNVLYCSSFEHPLYPGYEKNNDNEHILSVPLLAGTEGRVFQQKIASAWFRPLHLFQPQLIFFSAGFDGHINDPLADLHLTKYDYVWLTTEIAKIAKQYSEDNEGRIISVLEGGYHLPALKECVPAHIEAMAMI
jgi:acetoin utilization deacetylase AcuC-like enzyme